eukprot:scaffold5109_cov36-Attheya_sp.AAC.1
MEESREKESNWRERDVKSEPGARLDRQKKIEEKTRENTKKGRLDTFNWQQRNEHNHYNQR